MQIDGDPTATPHPRTTQWLFVTLLVLIDVVTVALAVMPVLFLSLGLQALGGTAGWWPGDPNSNDGEEVIATVFGATSLVLVLAVAAIPVVLLARWQRRPVLRTTARNILVLLGICLVMGVLALLR